MTAKTNTWVGQHGSEYEYWIYPIDMDNFKEEGGNYIFAREISLGEWTPQYIGETSNLNERLGNHEKKPCARRNGATHIHAHLNSNEFTRLSEEQDLIDAWSPICNG